MKKDISLRYAALSLAAAALYLAAAATMSGLCYSMQQSGTIGYYAAAGLTTVVSGSIPSVFLLLAGCSPQWRANGNAAGAPATFLYIAAGAALCTGLDILVSLLSGAPADTRITANIPLAIITLALLPAAAEELLFRGFILHSLRQYGDVFAVIISSVLFAAVHLNPAAAILAFLSGMVLGFIRIKTGRLLSSVLTHFIINSAAIIISAFC